MIRFVELDFEHGPLFELDPARKWILRVLDQDQLAGQARLDIIYQQLRQKG